jgi:rhodanese-related sulfurtransferase
MGWHLAGLELEHGSTRQAQMPTAAGMEKALAASARVADRFEVPKVSHVMVDQWRQDPVSTTFLLDVRSPAEYADGHLPGYRNAPGGQLVQATDEYVAVKNARLVLADNDGVRSIMTASWLIQMGWRDVYVLEGGLGTGPLESGPHEPTVLRQMDVARVTSEALANRHDNVCIIDLGPSTSYEQRHIPGAIWCVRARLADALADVANPASIVLVSPDGRLAQLALQEARALTTCDVQALDGGMARWFAEDRETISGLERTVGSTDDIWYKPYEHRGAQEKFMRDYLTWEVALVAQIERDGTTQFRAF